jgi:hypothetical protein
MHVSCSYYHNPAYRQRILRDRSYSSYVSLNNLMSIYVVVGMIDDSPKQ